MTTSPRCIARDAGFADTHTRLASRFNFRRPQQLAHAHDHPQRCRAKEPLRRTDACTAPSLPQRTAPHDESDVRHAIVAPQPTRQSCQNDIAHCIVWCHVTRHLIIKRGPRAARHALHRRIVMTVLLTFSASEIAAAPESPIWLPAAAPRAPVSSTKATRPRTRPRGAPRVRQPRDTHCKDLSS